MSRTSAREALLATPAYERRAAHIAVRGLGEVAQAPDVSPVLLEVVQLQLKLDTALVWKDTVAPVRDLTVSKPRRTRRGIVVRPPFFHSSRETMPSESKSISDIICRRIWSELLV